MAKTLKGFDGAIGQHQPEAFPGEVKEFLAKEGKMVTARLVGASLDPSIK
ncbi:MAG: M3 family oligoendopeptidase [Nitrospira sp.]|nr:M3 family oligoendopeptidase [Nitrospira sp.]